MRIKHLIFIFFLINTPIFAQQLPTFTNYANNWSLLNPAAVAPDFLLDDYYRLSIQAGYRQQWLGIEDAPKTQTLAFSWMPEDHPIIIGGQLINDNTGAIGLTGAYGQFAYRIKLDSKQHFAMGLDVGLVQYRAKVTEIRFLEKNDISASQDGVRLYPDFGIGIFYQLSNWLYGGLSVPQTFGLTHTFKAENRKYQLTRARHYYALAGANWYLNREKTTYLAFSTWAKYLPQAPFTLDFNTRYYFQEVFWLGLGIGTTKLAHLEVGVIVGNGLGYLDGRVHIGFGYDYALQTQAQLLGNTLELSVRYSINP